MRKTCQKSNVLIIEETEKKHTSNERYNEEEVFKRTSKEERKINVERH